MSVSTAYSSETVKIGAVRLMSTILFYGTSLSLSLALLIVAMLMRNPRLMLHSYPKDVRAVVAPKTPAELRESACWATIFLVLLLAFPTAAAVASKNADGSFFEVATTAFGVVFLFNLTDWLVLDWLIFCTITPAFAVLPGTAGMAGYKDYGMHVRGFLIGSMLSAALSLVVAAGVLASPV
jgi:hypothetical protein